MLTNHNPDRDSKFFKFINLAGNAIGLNLLFMVACIPVVTIGPALCGLFSGIRFMIREEGWFAGFKEGFRKRFVRTAIAGTVITGVLAFLVLNLNVAVSFFLETGEFGPIITYAIPFIPVLMLLGGMWPLNIYIPYKASDWLKNAVNLCFQAPLQVMATGVLLVVPAVLIIYFTWIAYYAAIIILAVYFVLAAFMGTILLKDALVQRRDSYRQENGEEQ